MLLPGVEGLRSLAEGARRAGLGKAIWAGLAAGVEAYAELTGDAGGSQAKLLRALRQQRPVSGERPGQLGARARRAYSLAARELTGIAAGTMHIVYVLRPGSEGATLRGWSAVGLVGVRGRLGHLPLTMTRVCDVSEGSGAPGPWEEGAGGGAGVGFVPGAVLGKYSSVPFPRVVAELRGERHTHVIDAATPRGLRGARERSVYFGQRFETRGVGGGGGGVHEVSVVPRVACDRLAVEVVVDGALRPGGIRTTGVFFLGSNGLVIGDSEVRWFDRLPSELHGPEFQEGVLRERVIGRQEELRADVLEAAGLEEAGVVSYSMVMEWPLPGWQHLFALRLGRGGVEGA